MLFSPRIAFNRAWLSVYALLAAALLGELGGVSAFADENGNRLNLLGPYENRISAVDEQHSIISETSQSSIPDDFSPWWAKETNVPLRKTSRALTIDIQSLVVGAMEHSPKVQAIKLTPEIRKTEIVEADAAFDSRAFLESKFIRTSDPVGNLLTTGGPSRFRDQTWYSNGGIRKKTSLGGQVEASQRFGYEDNNSIYYFPLPQGTSKLALSYTQPLLNGAGREYNSSATILASIDAGIAANQFTADLQDHLLDVNKAYWELYLQRMTLVEKRKLVKEAADISKELESRKILDANGGQIVRARSALETRKASLIRYEAAVRNAEAKVILLVHDPALVEPERAELIPMQLPGLQPLRIGVRDSLVKALHNRPEVDQAIQEIRAACIRERVAEKDLLPVLDAVLTTYASGLRGEGDIGRSWTDQFTVGEPTYSAGLMFEVPLGNRAAKAKLDKRRMEMRQYSLQLRQTVAALVEEVEVAVRDVDASYREAQSQYLAMKAAATEVKYLRQRWRSLPSEEQVAGIVLEDLLAAQERCGNSEIAFTAAQVSYNLSLANLNRATGVLLQCTAVPDVLPEEILTPAESSPLQPAPLPQSIAPLPPPLPYPQPAETANAAPATIRK